MKLRRPVLFLVPLLLLTGAAALCAEAPAGIPVGGRVVGPDGRGIAGARVELLPVLSRYEQGVRETREPGGPENVSERAARVSSGPDGGFDLIAPRAGMWAVTVTATGYVSLEAHLLPLLEPVILPDAELRRDAGLAVRVEDPDGSPLAGARVRSAAASLPRRAGLVTALPPTWHPAVRMAVTDAAGTVRLPRGDGEPLRLWAFAPGHALGRLSTADGAVVVRLPKSAPRQLHVEEADGAAPPGVVVREAGSGLAVAAVPPGEQRAALVTGADAALLLETADGRRVTVPPNPAAGPLTRVRLPPPEPRAGRVLAAAPRQPLAGAAVWPADDPGAAVTSDAAGVYRIERSAAAAAGLTAAATGYAPAARTETAASAPALPTLSLAAAAAVAGTVVDEQGRPVAGAAVEARPMDVIDTSGGVDTALAMRTPPERARSRADGTFRLNGLTTGGNYWLTTHHPGFADDQRNLPRREPARAALRIVLRRGAAVTGTAVDEDGRPVAGAAVELRAGPDALLSFPVWQDLSTRTETGADGSFRLSDLAKGPYSVRIDRPGAAPYYREGIDSGGAGPGGTTDLGRLVLPAGVRLAGRILDPAGRPLAGVRVWIQLRGDLVLAWNPRPDAVTGADGRFVLAGIPPGANQVVLDFCREGLGSEERELAELSPEPIDLVLHPVGRIAGRVSGPDGAPVAGVWVQPGHGDVEEATGLPHPCPTGDGVSSDAEGRFAVEGLRPGVYSLDVNGSAGPRIEGIVVPAGGGADGLEVILEGSALPKPADGREGESEKAPVYEVQGRVLDLAGTPIQGAGVSCIQERRSVDSAADGSFAIDLPATGCPLVAWADGYVWTKAPVPAAPADPVEIRLPNEATVTGRILGASPRELPWVVVSADYYTLGTVAADGSFRIAHLGPGEKEITARAGDRSVTRSVKIRPGQRKVRCDLKLEASTAQPGSR